MALFDRLAKALEECLTLDDWGLSLLTPASRAYTVAQAKDQASIDLYGLRQSTASGSHVFCDATAAQLSAQLQLQPVPLASEIGRSLLCSSIRFSIPSYVHRVPWRSRPFSASKSQR